MPAYFLHNLIFFSNSFTPSSFFHFSKVFPSLISNLLLINAVKIPSYDEIQIVHQSLSKMLNKRVFIQRLDL